MTGWLRQPPRLVALFLLVTLVPSLALVASGWRLLQQDRALSLNQLSERREQAADLVVVQLGSEISAAEQFLADPRLLASTVGADDGVVSVTFEPDRAEAMPAGRLLFYPRTEAGNEAPTTQFARGEELEYTRKSYAAAIDTYRRLARSADAPVRAGALIRLARTLRKAGEIDEALRVYTETARVADAAVAGVPADLLARWARCELLESLHRVDDLRTEARALQDDLLKGRWRLDRATFDVHAADAARWAGSEARRPDAANRLAFASAAETLWNDWRRGGPERGSGRQLLRLGDIDVTVLWNAAPQRFAAVLIAPSYVERRWIAKVGPGLERQHLRLSLRPSSDRAVAESEARRAASETGLPWTVLVQDVDPQADLARIDGRRTVWLWGLVLLAAISVGGIVIIARTVIRDLAVARLQSDFVSAVSHEFRTPLTSIRQLTEVLVDGRVVDSTRRDAYYRALARQTDRLHRLVESLLDFGRMEAGTSPYRLEPLDACELVRSIVDEFRQDSCARGYQIELNTQCLPHDTRISADREALTHAIWNLLDNAVKYSPECRTVWVEAERAGSQVAIRVRDRGLGISREERENIFRKFIRGSEAKRLGIKGTGIGLAMVRHIVAAQGGEVQLESQQGLGSTFTIVLPLVRRSATDDTQEQSLVESRA